MDILLQQIINGLVLGSMYALVALGYTMVYGIINLINFAHGEVLMVGALTSWTVLRMLAGSRPAGLGDAADQPGGGGGGVLGAELPDREDRLPPLRNAPRLAPLITAMGMSLLLQTLAMIIWQPSTKPYPHPAAQRPVLHRWRGDQPHPDPDPGDHGGRAAGA